MLSFSKKHQRLLDRENKPASRTGRPSLFLDVDGVFLAHYADRYQMRPYAGSFLHAAAEVFNLYWLTCVDSERTAALASLCGIHQLEAGQRRAHLREGAHCIEYAHWRDDRDSPLGGTSMGLDKLRGVARYAGISSDWWVLEDEFPGDEGRRLLHKHPELLRRWVICPRQGDKILRDATGMVEQYTTAKGLVSPVFWAETREATRA